MKLIKMAIRNLGRQKKRTVLLGCAIAFGVMVITLIQAFTTGAARNLKSNFSYLTAGHVFVTEQLRRDDDTIINEFRNHEVLEAALQETGLTDSRMVRRSEVMASILFSGQRSEQVISGVEWEQEHSLRERLVLLEGSMDAIIDDPRSLVLTGPSARRLGVEIGEEVLIRVSTVTGQQNVESLVVRGIMQDAGILGNMSSYAHLPAVNRAINIADDSYQAVHIELPRIELTDTVTRDLHAALARQAQVAERDDKTEPMELVSTSYIYQSGSEKSWSGERYVVSNINEYTGQIDQLASTLNSVASGLLFALLIITMVGVINTFRMVMLERTREIGTMRAVGMQRNEVKRLFLWEAFFMAALGYIAGILLAALTAALVSMIPVPLDNPLALFTRAGSLSFPFAFANVMINLIMISLLTIISAAGPARSAARLQPADALRSVA